MKRLFIAGIVVVSLLTATVIITLLLPHEADRLKLVLEEKPLDVWLEDLKYGTGDARNQAAAVLRRSGTNALPALLQMLGSKDSRLKLALVSLARKQSVIKMNFVLASERRSLAVAGFETLGLLANPALPQLNQLRRDPAVRADALHVIRIIEADSRPSH